MALIGTSRGVLTASGEKVADSWADLETRIELARLARRAGITAGLAYGPQRARERKPLPSEEEEGGVDGVIDRAIGDGHDKVRTDRAAVYLRREGGALVARRVVPRMGEATKRETTVMSASPKLAEAIIAPESLPRLTAQLGDGVCPVCVHKQRAAIERQIRAGRGAGMIGRSFKLSRKAVLVHARRHGSERA